MKQNLAAASPSISWKVKIMTERKPSSNICQRHYMASILKYKQVSWRLMPKGYQQCPDSYSPRFPKSLRNVEHVDRISKDVWKMANETYDNPTADHEDMDITYTTGEWTQLCERAGNSLVCSIDVILVRWVLAFRRQVKISCRPACIIRIRKTKASSVYVKSLLRHVVIIICCLNTASVNARSNSTAGVTNMRFAL